MINALIKFKTENGTTERIEMLDKCKKHTITRIDENGTLKNNYREEKFYHKNINDDGYDEKPFYYTTNQLKEKMLSGTRDINCNGQFTQSKINYYTDEAVIRDEEFDNGTTKKELNINEYYKIDIKSEDNKINNLNLKIGEKINVEILIDSIFGFPKAIINIGNDEYELDTIRVKKDDYDSDKVLNKREYKSRCYNEEGINILDITSDILIKEIETKVENGKTITIKEVKNCITNETKRYKVEKFVDNEGYDCTRTTDL